MCCEIRRIEECKFIFFSKYLEQVQVIHFYPTLWIFSEIININVY